MGSQGLSAPSGDPKPTWAMKGQEGDCCRLNTYYVPSLLSSESKSHQRLPNDRVHRLSVLMTILQGKEMRFREGIHPNTAQPGNRRSGLKSTAEFLLPRAETPCRCLWFGFPLSSASLRSISASWGKRSRKGLFLSRKIGRAERWPVRAVQQRPGCVFAA